jgi:hypothetical protein
MKHVHAHFRFAARMFPTFASATARLHMAAVARRPRA